MKVLYILKVIALFILKLAAKLLLKIAEFLTDMICYLVIIIRVLFGKLMKIAGGIGVIICAAAIWYYKQFRADMIPFAAVTLALVCGVEILELVEMMLTNISVTFLRASKNISMEVA